MGEIYDITLQVIALIVMGSLAIVMLLLLGGLAWMFLHEPHPSHGADND